MKFHRTNHTPASRAATDRATAAQDRGDLPEAVREAKRAYDAGTPELRAAIDAEIERLR